MRNEARTRIIERVEEKKKFLDQHPEMINCTGALLSTVMSCTSDHGLEGPFLQFEQAWQHVFGKKGCYWCSRNFIEIRRLQNKAAA